MPAAVWAIRGATTLDADRAEHYDERVGELLKYLFERNDLNTNDVISMILTATPDLRATFPAAAARRSFAGLDEVPVISAVECDVAGGLAQCVRILIHVNTYKPRHHMRHVFLRGAKVLREDLADPELP